MRVYERARVVDKCCGGPRIVREVDMTVNALKGEIWSVVECDGVR